MRTWYYAKCYIYIYIFFLIFGRSDRASTAGHGYGKCKKILACEAQSAQQPNMETCKNAKNFAIVLQYCPKGRTALQYNGIKKIVFLMFSSSLSSLIISRSFFLSLSFFFPYSLFFKLEDSTFLSLKSAWRQQRWRLDQLLWWRRGGREPWSAWRL